MDVARQEDDARGRSAPLAGAHLVEDRDHLVERVVERAPVLEVYRLAHLLRSARRALAPASVGYRLVPRLHLVQTTGQEVRQRRTDEEVVDVTAREVVEPGPLRLVEQCSLPRREDPTAS